MEKLENKNLKIAEYLRKSSRDGERQVLSLEGQEDAINKVREKHKTLTPAISKYQEARSAKNAHKRPLFTQMLSDIFSGKINCILAWHLNRIARNMTEGGILIDLLSEGKLMIITVCDDNIEVWDDSSDVSVIAQKFGASKEYSLALSRDVKRGQRDKARTMGLPSGLATIGYLNSKQGEKGTRWWYVDDERFWKVQKLLEEFLSGRYSITKIHKYAVEELKLTTAKHKNLGGNFVTREYIGKLLHNPVIAGFFYVQGERHTLDSNLPRMITETNFNKIEQILGGRNKPKNQKHEMTYTGFINSSLGYTLSQDIKVQLWCDCKHKFAYRDKTHCPKCNKRISTLENPKYFIQQYYFDNRKKKKKLEYHSVTEERVNTEFIQYAKDNLSTPSPFIDWGKKYIHEIAEQEVKDGLRKIEDIEKRKQQYDDKKKRATRLFIEGSLTKEERDDFLAEIDIEYSDIYNSKPVNTEWVKKLDEITDVASSVINTIENGSYEAKRRVLTALGSNIVWDEEKLIFYSKKSIEVFFSGIKMIQSNFEGFGNEKTLTYEGLNHQNEEFCITMRRR